MPRTTTTTCDYTPSTLPPNHILVQLGPPRGSHNFLCNDINGVERLVEMPNKVRRLSYAARGMFAIVSLWDEADIQSSLVGEIVHVVTGPELKSWRRSGEWPKQFEHPSGAGDVKDDRKGDKEGGANPDEDEDELGLPGNPNRPKALPVSDDEDEDDDEDHDESDDEDE